MTRTEARNAIEARFRKAVDRDVSLLVHDRLEQGTSLQTCRACNEAVSARVWSAFQADWRNVHPNPGGTSGKAAAFLQRKTELVYRLALNGGARTEKTADLERDLSASLLVLWLEWAGYMVTSEPELIAALD